MTRRTALVAVATAALTLVATPALATVPTSAPTSAPTSDPTPGSTTTITVDTAALDAFCHERLPKAQARVQAVIDRIQGDASTQGSAAWVRARADQAAAAGHDDLARRLTFRADQRLGHLDELGRLQTRLAGLASGVCAQVGS